MVFKPYFAIFLWWYTQPNYKHRRLKQLKYNIFLEICGVEVLTPIFHFLGQFYPSTWFTVYQSGWKGVLLCFHNVIYEYMPTKHILKADIWTYVMLYISHITILYKIRSYTHYQKDPQKYLFPPLSAYPPPYSINGNGIGTQKSIWQLFPERLVLCSNISWPNNSW